MVLDEFSRVAQSIDGDTATAQTAVTRGLKVLTGIGGVVAADVPAGAAPNSRLRRHRVADPYLRFWFRAAAGRHRPHWAVCTS
ncbi:hypothetical protein SAMN04488561_4440 [Jiangella alba]|uniref:Uncharacterized protein n=1 Tax=Jiangella alba TaxID=561176 RepID=A0A1H5PJ16_9ACTN|nr:hypothetical protein SAMN04488561_4440 [Jiangella alba]